VRERFENMPDEHPERDALFEQLEGLAQQHANLVVELRAVGVVEDDALNWINARSCPTPAELIPCQQNERLFYTTITFEGDNIQKLGRVGARYDGPYDRRRTGGHSRPHYV
jgi:hypothetical protein